MSQKHSGTVKMTNKMISRVHAKAFLYLLMKVTSREKPELDSTAFRISASITHHLTIVRYTTFHLNWQQMCKEESKLTLPLEELS